MGLAEGRNRRAYEGRERFGGQLMQEIAACLALALRAVTAIVAGSPWDLVVGDASAGEPASLTTVQVTATREPEPIADVPASMTIVSGEELRARGAQDLRTALELAAGVEGTPGGDSGPAGAVPSIWGLREADAYLLVVDGVPWGGAFIPATPSITLSGVERIEILRGPAPVMYGATSFAGVIHVIHHSAGDTPTELSVSGGSHGSYGLSGNSEMPSSGAYAHALTVDLEHRGYDEDRTAFDRYHALYRGTTDLSFARFHVDFDISILSQEPAGNLLLRDGTVLHREFPPNANYNPTGAALDQDRYNLSLGLDGSNSLGDWSVSLAATRTNDDLLRGFLRGTAFSDPPDGGVGDGLQADGYAQSRGITDLYLDFHLTADVTASLKFTYGVDYLYGDGSQHATNFGYCIDADGSELTWAGAHHPDELVRSADRRNFAGLYAQAFWRASDSVDVLAGLRFNHTSESAHGRAIDNTGPAPVIAFEGGEERSNSRPSGVLGANWHAWSSGNDALTLYADYRNSYKPLAIDFGPEAETDVLQPETAESYEAGARVQLIGGRLDLDSSIFRVDFTNGLTFEDDGTGHFVRANGAETRFQGFEIESRFQWLPQLELIAHYAYHDARFVRFTRDNGADAGGNRFEMSPRHLGGIGLIYTWPTGFSGSLVADYVGSRELNKSNSVESGRYTTLDCSLGYRFAKYRVQLSGYNLSDRRDPVAESELSEAVTVTGTAGYYRLPGRYLEISFSFAP
jgi:outer membrane receptor protein involved in Fe transport